MEAKNLPTIGESLQSAEMQKTLKRKMRELQRSEAVGSMGSVRASVLGLVVGETYDRAASDLREYVEDRTAFPNFQDRAQGLVQHCVSLIQAIESKRNLPGLATMSMSKQQELHEKVLEHFDELKQNLQYIERLERDHHLSDVRSTVWVVYAFSFVIFAVLGALVVLDVRSGLLTSTIQETSLIVDQAGDWVVNHIPFL